MSRRAANVVIAAAAWTACIWVVRFWNMLGDDHATGFLVVHGAIASVSVVFAVALFAIGWHGRRAAEAPHSWR